jgi:hypothetical protein
MNGSGKTDLFVLLIVVYFGICYGAVYAYISKKFLGDFVQKLIQTGATSAETAKSLSQLEYKSGVKTKLMQNALKSGKGLRKSISVCFPEANTKTDAVQKYFLPDEKKENALHRYSSKGSTLSAVITAIVLFLVLILILSSALPPLWKMTKRIPEQFKVPNDVGYTDPDEKSKGLADESEMPPEFEFGTTEKDGQKSSDKSDGGSSSKQKSTSDQSTTHK